MACACGTYHTITLSNDGTLHSFGKNEIGQLGLGHNDCTTLPSRIPNLPKIQQVSCGWNFTVCVDNEGFVWSFGLNSWGQLGIGNKVNSNIPKKIQDIPPVLSVSCGAHHTLIITNDSELWSCGNNNYGQLCYDEPDDLQVKFRATSFSSISRISCGYFYSLFGNEKGEIFSCGSNKHGEVGLGHFIHNQITPTLIPNLPLNIEQFICGGSHTLILDTEGKVFSFGYNHRGQLGLGHTLDQNILNQILNIPPIQSISCVGYSSYLIDYEGNLWSFGHNRAGQLGHDDGENRLVPTKIESLKDIQQISYGPCGEHILVKDSQKTIFAIGYNAFGQFGIAEPVEETAIPKEISPEYFTIWGEPQIRAKSARK